MPRTALDDTTLLRDPPTKIVASASSETGHDNSTPSGPVVKSAGQGQQKAVNPLLGGVTEQQYLAVQNAKQAAQTATQTPQRGTVAQGVSAKANSVTELAKKYVGTPYVWGASSPLGFDCSGFTQYVFKQFGVDLPRVSNQQGFGGQAVASQAEAQPGDLIFWDNSSRNNGADHVGIYLGNGMLISAPKPGDKVKIQAVYGKPFFRRYL